MLGVLLLCSVAVLGDSVHFTNSQSQLERSSNRNSARDLKTYQLDVPGSNPITIVEAEPWNNAARNTKALSIDAHLNDERKTKDYLVPGSTHEKLKDSESSRCIGLSCDEVEMNKKKIYSPDLINRFLKEYAEKIKNADQKIRDRLKKMEITSPKNNYNIITADNIYSKNQIKDKMDFKDSDSNRRYTQWDEIDAKKHKHPFEDSEGWVAMEAVPWTRSKISKWQANAYKINKPQNNYNSFGIDRDPPHHTDKFSTNYDNPESDYNYGSRPQNSPYNFPKPVLNNERPFYESSQADNDWPQELPSRPSWEKPSHQNRPYQGLDSDAEKRPHRRPDCDHPYHQIAAPEDTRRLTNQYYEHGGIITDGKPGGFPSNSFSSYKKKDMQYSRPTDEYDEEQQSDHPASHPSNGNGQWVLLSTTKGYKFPKSRQRSMSFNPTALTSRRSVRLTVLPAVNGSKENMTLSHGGMLEVEPSFQSVDESRRIYERQRKVNASSALKPKKTRRVLATSATPDSSAVMAAVGAGLVPATVAMIMPMVLGRKKRSVPVIYSFQNVTQHPQFDFESTLQRSL